MTPNSPLQIPTLAVIGFALTAITVTGCTSIKLPAHPFTKGGSDTYVGVDSAYRSDPSMSKEIYHAVRRARAENGVVLQVIGDSSPVRVMPLPPAGKKSVFLSHLLDQTGVQKKLGSIEATLFRHSTDSIGGIPMKVLMTDDGHSIRPESDYALQAGDRVRVAETPDPGVQQLFNSLLGL